MSLEKFLAFLTASTLSPSIYHKVTDITYIALRHITLHYIAKGELGQQMKSEWLITAFSDREIILDYVREPSILTRISGGVRWKQQGRSESPVWGGFSLLLLTVKMQEGDMRSVSGPPETGKGKEISIDLPLELEGTQPCIP